jgi:D-ribose pyranose/furanose isomerase RbsD
MKNIVLTLIIALSMSTSCTSPSGQTAVAETNDWKTILNAELPLLGHRNWILVVDKAFPAQNAPGIHVVNTGEELLPVLKYTLDQISQSTHVNPVIYTDKELNFITPELESGIESFKKSLKEVLNGADVQTILHDSVFTKIDEASKLFKVLVLKTEGTIAYSSVFLNLDCKYWGGEKENVLRQAMNEK